MMSGPVLHHRKTIGQLAKLWVFLDGSQSMSLSDASMDTGRKILILQRLGLISSDAVKLDLPKAGEALADAQNASERALAAAAIESGPVETTHGGVRQPRGRCARADLGSG
jgi:hypothetical protein